MKRLARYSGINTNRVITLAYVVAGGLTAISGVIIAFYTNSVSPVSHGNFDELYGIAAAVLGGCSLRGGEGSVVGILIGHGAPAGITESGQSAGNTEFT